MAERTPPTVAVKQAWIVGHPFRATTTVEGREAEFDRWLAEVRREAAEKAAVEVGVCEHQNANYLRMMSERDALRAEVERLRAVSAAQPYETERELAVALDETRQQVADLRAGIEALLPGETVNVYAGGGNLVSQRRVVDPDHLRTLLAGSGEQPGEGRGPVRDGWCCWTCADLAAAAGPAPMVPDSAGLRERVRDVFVNAERRESFGGTDIDSLTDAVLAVVGQGVTAERRDEAILAATREVAKQARPWPGDGLLHDVRPVEAADAAVRAALESLGIAVRPSGQEGS